MYVLQPLNSSSLSPPSWTTTLEHQNRYRCLSKQSHVYTTIKLTLQFIVSKLISLLSLAWWAFLRTTSHQSNNWILVSSRSLKNLEGPNNFSVRPIIIGPYLVILRHDNSNVNIYFLFAVSGGFAVVQPDSQLSINAVEAYPLEDFSAEVRRNTSHFPKKKLNCGHAHTTSAGKTDQNRWAKFQAVKAQIAEAQKVAAGGGGSEQDIAEAKIELEVWKINGYSPYLLQPLKSCHS